MRAVGATLRRHTDVRALALAANDGIVATAGILQGFAGAGAGDRLLLFTATAATIAGGLSSGGAMWAEKAAERDTQLLVAEQERRDLQRDPAAEIEELAAHWEERGLSPDLAHEVAEELTARDGLAAQLDWEYGFESPMTAAEPVRAGVFNGLAYTAGASIPLLITYFAPVRIETWAILLAVVIALLITAAVSASTGQVNARNLVVRTLVVAAWTIAASYAVGTALL